MLKHIRKETADKVITLANKSNAMIEQTTFNEFDRTLILSTDGIVSIKIPNHTDCSYLEKTCSIQEFHGFNNKTDVVVKSTFKPIQIKGFNYELK